MRIKGTALRVVAAGICLSGIVGHAHAAVIDVTSDIAVSTTWTANNTYNLTKQIYVLPGASLTIEAGVVVASDVTVNGGGALAVTKGAQIFICGTKENPVIMTSEADVATWSVLPSHPTGRDPKTGSWRAAANEWGNLTIMGCGYITEDKVVGNVPTCNAGNQAPMEGLTAAFPGDPNVLYGGGDDDDDSGKIEFLSIRYGGRVVGLNNELNGLSLGGVGRETEINYVEIMNNVDDGIEIWGGCVALNYFSIWNVGDDSLDVDQGWRGKAQFGLIVQGYSLDASQGSGVGDNCIEVDGAEDSDWQPVTTTTMYNLTVIGQPVSGDGGTAWRDNARVQYRNSIFMDLGDQLVRFDNSDGDCGNGYGFNGTLSWAQTWTTNWNAAPAHANDCPSSVYKVQVDGKLAEIKDSVFYRNLAPNAYTEATTRGVFAATCNNVNAGSLPADMPITSITRGAPVSLQGGSLTMLPVVGLDPRPANDALESAEVPDHPCFVSAAWRGAFGPRQNWLRGWTASGAFGFTENNCEWWTDGKWKPGTKGVPVLTGGGNLVPGGSVSLFLANARPNTQSILVVGFAELCAPFSGGTLVPQPSLVLSGLPVNSSGNLNVTGTWASLPPGFKTYFQYWVLDPLATFNLATSNGLVATQP